MGSDNLTALGAPFAAGGQAYLGGAGFHTTQANMQNVHTPFGQKHQTTLH